MRPRPIRTWLGHLPKAGPQRLFVGTTILMFLCLVRVESATFNIANGDITGLKSAINTANSNGQDDTINMATNGTYVLTTVDNVFSGPNGLPVVGADGGSRRLTVNGNGATITRSTAAGTPEFRLFYLNPINTNAVVTISGVTFSNGRVSASKGGALFTNGFIVLNNCTIANNFAMSGGGISNLLRVLELNYCTLTGNGAQGAGGAIENASGDVGLNTCTLASNSASGASGVINISSEGGTTLEIFNCTLSDSGIANIWNGFTTTVSVGDTILSNSSISNPNFGTITSFGYNLSTDNGGGFLNGPGDHINTNPGFDPAGLAFNGGPTQTIALIAGSAAIDQGNSAGVPIDQRGVARILDNPGVVNAAGGDGSDIGAFEAAADPIQSGTPSFVVTTTADHNDGTCGGSDCTLREALQRTNTFPGANVITFAPGVTGTITLLPAQGGQLSISDSVSILGPGARALAIGSGTQSRLLLLTGGSSFISGLTLRDGFQALGPAGGSNVGGAVLNQAAVLFRDCTFRDNRASGSSGIPPGGHGGAGSGGAIANAGTLTVEKCTFLGNGATGAFGANNPPPDDFTQTTGGNGGAGRGAGIFNDTGGTLTITNCTFVSNNAGGAGGGSGHFGGTGGAGQGGAIFNLGMMFVTGATFSGNGGSGGTGGQGRFSFLDGPAGRGIGGLAAGGGASTVRNTVSANNTGNNGGGGDVDGVFASEGYNLIRIGDFSSGFNQAGDQVGTTAAPINALLGPLQNNGGDTDTMRVLTGSPALDQGKKFNLSVDQRGQMRPHDDPAIPNASGGDGSDIGAFEIGGGLLTVTTTADHTDGNCDAIDCTLREAITAANAQLDSDTIRFAPGVTGTIQLASALPSLSSDITLEGPGANILTVRRNTAAEYRIFTVENGSVTLEGLTISNGFLPASGNLGGGIYNDGGNLIVTRCALTGNHAYAGGGLYNAGANGASATLTGCTLSGNSAFEGGGIDNVAIGGDATLSVSNSTLSGNTASNNGGGISNGTLGGSVALTLTNCTLSGNSAPTGGGVSNGISFGGSATVLVRNTILKTGASGANLANSGGTITSQGSNRSNDSGGGFLVGSGDLTNADPMLGILQDNGGPTLTHALFPGSNAINNGNGAFAPNVDQRGYTRSGVSDIGAFEFGGAPPPPPTPTPSPTPTPTPTSTSTPTPTPTPTPTLPPINISGAISYCSNPVPGPVPNVTLTLSGSGSGSTMSNSSGNYQFLSLAAGGSYAVTPSKASLTPGAPGSSINTIDLLATQRHFLNVALLSGCRLMAADVNSDGAVTTIDVIGIERFYLGLTTGIANVGKYSFSPVVRNYPGVVTNQAGQNYDALVFGDVASPFAARDGSLSQDTAGEGLPADPPIQ